MRVTYLTQRNNSSLWWGLNLRLRGIHKSKHCNKPPVNVIPQINISTHVQHINNKQKHNERISRFLTLFNVSFNCFQLIYGLVMIWPILCFASIWYTIYKARNHCFCCVTVPSRLIHMYIHNCLSVRPFFLTLPHTVTNITWNTSIFI